MPGNVGRGDNKEKGPGGKPLSPSIWVVSRGKLLNRRDACRIPFQDTGILGILIGDANFCFPYRGDDVVTDIMTVIRQPEGTQTVVI